MERREIKRDHYLQKLIDRKNNGMIKVITGIRRCGKSYLLFTLFRKHLLESGVPPERIITLALDDDTGTEYRDPEKLAVWLRSRITGSEPYYILLDEVQLAVSREEMTHPESVRLYGVLNGLLRRENVDVYVTGSNSKLLTKDVMTVFRGRGDEVRVYPLSFREYYSAVGGDAVDAYEEYALYGGMPLSVFQRTEQDKMNYLRRLFTEVFFKDISERYTVRYPRVLDELADALCSSVGSLTNVSKLGNTLKTVQNLSVSANTIAKYLGYLTDAFLFSEAKRYDVKGRKYFTYPSKFYCADTGLRNARLNFRQLEETHLMESILYQDLLCRDCMVDVGIVDLYETKDGTRQRRQCEIDFVVNQGAKRVYIQSALRADDPQKLATEVRPFRNAGDFFGKVLVTKTRMKPWTDENGILRIGLYDFLLSENVPGL